MTRLSILVPALLTVVDGDGVRRLLAGLLPRASPNRVRLHEADCLDVQLPVRR
jgi:hypothetical protein